MDIYSVDDGLSENTQVAAAMQLEADDFAWLMSHKQGRRIVRRLLDKAGIYRTTFTGDERGAFLEGMRNMGLMLLADVQAHAGRGDFILMLQEGDVSERNADD